MAEVDLSLRRRADDARSSGSGPPRARFPGAVAGLEAAHRAYGRLPWRELLAPAVELARGGVELTRTQAHMHAILDPILRFDDEGRRVYGRNGSRLVAGDTLLLPDLADTLEAIGRRGAAALYSGERARAIVATVRDGGGALTLDDLRRYRRRLAAAGPRRLPRLRGDLEPAAVVGRRADRVRPRAARAARRRGARAAPRRSRALVETMREQHGARGGELRRATCTAAASRGGSSRTTSSTRALDRIGARSRAARRADARAGRRDDARLGDRRRRQRRVALDLDRLRLGRDRPGHRRVPEQHARRVRPRDGAARAGRAAAVEHDGAVDRARRATARRGSSSAARARRACAARSCRSSSTCSSTGCRCDDAIDAPRVHVDEPHVHCEGGHDPRRARPSSRRPATTSSAGGGATSSSAASRRSRCSPTARSRPPAIRAGAAPASSSSGDRRRPCGRAGRRAGADALADAVAAEPEGWVLLYDAAAAERRRRAALPAARCAATRTAPCSWPRPTARSSAGSRSRATRTRRARTSPTSALMVAAVPPPPRRRHRAPRRRRGVGARRRRREARAARLPAQRAGDRPLREARLRARGPPPRPLPPRGRRASSTRS